MSMIKISVSFSGGSTKTFFVSRVPCVGEYLCDETGNTSWPVRTIDQCAFPAETYAYGYEPNPPVVAYVRVG